MARLFGVPRVRRWLLVAVIIGLAIYLFSGEDKELSLPAVFHSNATLSTRAIKEQIQGKTKKAQEVVVAPAEDESSYVLPPVAEWPDVELWASGTAFSSPPMAAALKAELGPAMMKDVEELCGRCLFHTLLEGRTQVFGTGQSVFVATGDIHDEWLRDGAVQLGVFLPRVDDIAGLRNLVDVAIKTQAYYLMLDPWANSFSQNWRTEKDLKPHDMELGRYGFVSTRNYEPDTGAYFLNLLYNYYMTEPPIWGRERFLNETIIHDAVITTLRTYRIEQEHHKRSPYRYKELHEGGMGGKVGYTGMIWGGFRPSDDKQEHGYNVPVNMYVCGALEKMLLLNSVVWRDPEIETLAGEMAEQIRVGIERYGRVKTSDTKEYIYAYEVNGLGQSLADFDDPNVPSLMSVPILGYRHYDEAVYLRTKQRLLSEANPYYFETEYDAAKNNYKTKQGKVPFFGGTGSPHTPKGNIWPLGTMVEAILDQDVVSRADAFRLLLEMQCGNGLMHESVNVNNVASCTRPIFEWANTMFVVLFESSFGRSCQKAFEKHRLEELGKAMSARGVSGEGLLYGTLLTRVKHWSGGGEEMSRQEISQKISTDVKNEVNNVISQKMKEKEEKEKKEREKAAADKAAAEKAAKDKAAAEKAAAEKAAAEKAAADAAKQKEEEEKKKQDEAAKAATADSNGDESSNNAPNGAGQRPGRKSRLRRPPGSNPGGAERRSSGPGEGPPEKEAGEPEPVTEEQQPPPEEPAPIEGPPEPTEEQVDEANMSPSDEGPPEPAEEFFGKDGEEKAGEGEQAEGEQGADGQREEGEPSEPPVEPPEEPGEGQ